MTEFIAELMVGFAMMVFVLVGSYFFYQMARSIKSGIDKEETYNIVEELGLEKYASTKGIDVQKELAKRDIFSKKKRTRSFKRRLEDEIITDFFGKESESDKK